jgi:hypothetical protein
VSALVPDIMLSDGATVLPSAGTPQDFSRPVTYTVTAADGKHQRVYTVELTSVSMYKFGFEHWEALSAGYTHETPVEFDFENKRYTPWDSSNKGIAVYQQFNQASLYPIHKTTVSAQGQYAAEMVTQEGLGSIMGIINIPVVAGSLFTGVLNTANVLQNPLLATEFGQPFDQKPARMTGKYIYKAGSVYIDRRGKVAPQLRDSCAVYAVFYRSDQTLERLNGTNIQTHPNIVAMATMPYADRAGTAGDGFVSFDLPFVYAAGHEVDFEKNNYKLTIVFSSSFLGDYYEGAPGSRLVVDDIEIITEDKQE